MFFEIGCFFLLIISADSAADPCPTALAKKDIRAKLPVYKDAKGDHCFFQLSKADEEASYTFNETAKEWRWIKTEAGKKCDKHKAILPRLKDPSITDFFVKKLKAIGKNGTCILLGIKKVDKKGEIVNLHWDDDTTLNVRVGPKGVYGKYDFTFYNETRLCYNNVDVEPGDESWACWEPGVDDVMPAVFCQLTLAPTTPTTTPTTTPKGAAIRNDFGHFPKVNVMATTLVIYYTLSAHYE